MSNDIFAETKLWDVYERPGVAGLCRDFQHPKFGFGTLSEILAPYDSTQAADRIASFVVTLVSVTPPKPIPVETLPSPFDRQVLTDEELSQAIIEQGIAKLTNS